VRPMRVVVRLVVAQELEEMPSAEHEDGV
jgi:hypothetical protein